MRELVADLFVSLDGYAGSQDSPAYFGYGGPELERSIAERLAEPQVLVFGRRTYELLADFAAGQTDPQNRRMAELPKLVVSRSLEGPLAWENSELVRGEAAETLASRKQAGDGPLRILGSISLVSGLVRAGVLDRLRVTLFPLVLGPKGREPLFASMPPGHLALDGCRVLDGRLVALEYRPARG